MERVVQWRLLGMQWEGEEFFTPRLTRIAPNDANVFSSPLLTPSFPSAAFCGTLTRGGGGLARDGSGFKRVIFHIPIESDGEALA